jgi:phosphatidylserine/phosphatidylglycerophosphate/cardiolipin synthase-like enzyme
VIRPFPRLTATLLLGLVLAIPAAADHAVHPNPPGEGTTCPTLVRFSPHGGAEQLVVETLRRARERVHVAIYGLTSPAIEAALHDLARAGVRVVLKADHVQSAGKAQAAALERLAAAGATVQVSRMSRLLHDKFAVVDGRWVITGSFNWTASAENRNRENVLVFDCPALAEAFEAEWEVITPDSP